MKKTLGIVGILALSITPTASFPHHLEPKESEIRPGGNLAHTNLSFADLFGANLSGADLDGANLSGAVLDGPRLNVSSKYRVIATGIRGCPSSLPNGWFCENNSLIQR